MSSSDSGLRAGPPRFEGFEELLLAVADSLESGAAAGFRRRDSQASLFDEAEPYLPHRDGAERGEEAKGESGGHSAGGRLPGLGADGGGAPAGRAPPEAAALIRSRSPRLFGASLRTALCAEPPVEALLEVAAAVGRRGDVALGDFTSPSLRALASAARALNREIHLLLGFARFESDAEERYVAVLEPEHDVLPALVPHFLRRFGTSPFALVDLGRAYALAAPGFSAPETPVGRGPGAAASRGGGPGGRPPSIEDFLVLEGEAALALVPAACGAEAELFRRYCAAVENPARRNAALQRRLMPRRYWRQLVELGPEARGS